MTTHFRHMSFWILLLLVAFSSTALGQEATFIPNQGQWVGDFEYKTDLSNGALFFTKKGWQVVLLHSEDGHHHGKESNTQHTTEPTEAVNLKMQWLNANVPEIIPQEKEAFHKNYFLGDDQNRWKSNVPVYRGLNYHKLYDGVDAFYYTRQGELKYDLLLKTGKAAEQIKMKFEGQTELSLSENRLVVQTELGNIEEWIPEAYQWIESEKRPVSCTYTLEDGIVGFSLGKHNPDYEVIIDPILVFSTFSGSVALHFGFTATYDLDDNFYGGGAALNVGFQATPGAFQIPFGNGPMDVTINKFSADGSSLLYATHLGGSRTDAPHSLNITPQNELLILGNTDSDNFPTSNSAYQKQYVQGPDLHNNSYPFFHKGSNIFVCKLSADGSSLLASTLFGDSGGDGFNRFIYKNYGDRTRGDILNLPNGNIAFTSSALSKNLPLDSNGLNLSGASQKAIVAVFNPNLSQLVWGTYIGGTGNETGYSIKSDGTYLYVAGSSTSFVLPETDGAIDTINQGKIDGYISKFRISDGSLIRSTHIGGTEDDQVFFIDLDKDNNLYLHGQTKSALPLTPGKYGTAGAHQFIQKLSNNLDTVYWSTTVGTGQKTDWVPTAFMIDQCYNIYTSGWNGETNSGPSGNNFGNNNTNGLPISADAFQSTTDGSDFYFMVLSRDAQSFVFGSYFGGTSEEHVDGGTSRFSPDGVIYQAVCAACSGLNFPTTPSSYSPTKPNGECNLGAIKIDFEQTVRSLPQIDPSLGFDTICDSLTVHLNHNSLHANKFTWYFGNGDTSNLEQPAVTYTTLGTYTITLVAEDTVCGIADTNTLVVVHNKGVTVVSDFDLEYAGCDKNYEVNFQNLSDNAQNFIWDFGDGTTSNLQDPTHSYPDTGNYTVRLIAINALCNKRDTIEQEIFFVDTLKLPIISTSYRDCSDGKVDIDIENDRNRYTYSWKYNNKSSSGSNPDIRFSQRGTYEVEITITDTICNVNYVDTFTVNILTITKSTFVPNSFTPNDDGINDVFAMSGESCNEDEYMRIYNRWGQLIFETNDPFNTFWDGTYKGSPAQQGVYTYILKVGEEVMRNYITLIR